MYLVRLLLDCNEGLFAYALQFGGATFASSIPSKMRLSYRT